MRILVCGGRDYGHVVRTKATLSEELPEVHEKLRQYRHVHDTLHKLVMEHSLLRNDRDNWLPTDIVIIAGGATGADSAAADFAIVQWCQLQEYPADWVAYGGAAGPIRNQQMLDEGKPDLVVAFPGGRGTADMVRRAKKANVRIIEVGA